MKNWLIKKVFFVSVICFFIFPISVLAWSCGSNITDTRDSASYSTVLIGTQCWMAQNLNVGTRIAGASSQGTDCASASAIQKYCYSDSDANCTTYGGIYQWNQTMCGSTTAGAQGICPTGWHVPTHDEWTTLERAVCTSGSCATDFPYDSTTGGWRGTNEGDLLKIAGKCSGRTPCGSSGFNALIAGYRLAAGTFNDLNSYAYIWTSLENGTSAWARHFGPGDATILRSGETKTSGLYVRCLKDNLLDIYTTASGKAGYNPQNPFNPSPNNPKPSINNPSGLPNFLINPVFSKFYERQITSEQVNDSVVTLNFFAGNNIKFMTVSSEPDPYGRLPRIPYQNGYQYDLCKENSDCPDGTYSVYVYFYTAEIGTGGNALARDVILKRNNLLTADLSSIVSSMAGGVTNAIFILSTIIFIIAFIVAGQKYLGVKK